MNRKILFVALVAALGAVTAVQAGNIYTPKKGTVTLSPSQTASQAKMTNKNARNWQVRKPARQQPTDPYNFNKSNGISR